MTRILSREYRESDGLDPKLLQAATKGDRFRIIIFETIEGEPVAYAGLAIDDFAGMGEFWLTPRPAFYRLPHAPIAIRKAMRVMENAYGLDRYMMKTYEPAGARFAEWLGYEHEGTMRKAMRGRDVNIYARVK